MSIKRIGGIYWIRLGRIRIGICRVRKTPKITKVRAKPISVAQLKAIL